VSENDVKKKRFRLLAVIAIVGVLFVAAGVILSNYFGNRCTAGYKVQCMSQLMQIYTFAASYADASKDGAFPIAEGPNPRAHDSLNVLVEFHSEGLEPRSFLCPAGEDNRAPEDKDGRFRLSDDTLDYAWTAKKVRLTGPKQPLAADKYVRGYADGDGEHDGHAKGMNVLYTDGTIRFVPEEELPRDPDPETGMAMLPRGLIR
jgi:hypothetical protein